MATTKLQTFYAFIKKAEDIKKMMADNQELTNALSDITEMVDTEALKIVDTLTEPEELKETLEKLTVAGIKRICKERQITNYSKLNKTDLIELVVNELSDSEAEAETDDDQAEDEQTETDDDQAEDEQTETDDEQESYTEEELSSLNTKELKKICKDAGLKKYSKLKKAELIQLILNGPPSQSDEDENSTTDEETADENEETQLLLCSDEDE